jgi:hypothetical protein
MRIHLDRLSRVSGFLEERLLLAVEFLITALPR